MSRAVWQISGAPHRAYEEAYRGLDDDRRNHVGQDVAEEDAEAAPPQGLRGLHE